MIVFFLCVGKGNRIKREGLCTMRLRRIRGGNIAVSHGDILFTRILRFVTVIYSSHGLLRFVTELFLSRDSSFDPLIMEYFITRLVFRPSGQREAMRIRGYAGLRLSFAKINKNH